MSVSRLLTIGAVVVVLAFYAFVGSDGRMTFPLVSWQESYYASLSEGFLRGQLNMAHDAAPSLMRLPDPYDHYARKRARVPVLWDASYFEGKYYLYFSPLPALLFYVPVRLVAGAYPSDAFATTLFTGIAFLVFVACLRRALPQPRIPTWFWVLVLGLGNVVPYVLVRARVYQVPIACALMFSGGFAYFLLRFVETRTGRSVLGMGLCLGLAIASRPNLGVLLLIAGGVVLVQARRRILALLAPLVLIGAVMLWYNAARFRSPFDFGICHMLNMVRLGDCAQCGLRNTAELMRLANGTMHYLFWAPAVHGEFPWIDLQRSRLDASVSYLGRAEPVSGIATTTPLILVGTAFAAVLALRRGAMDPAARAGTLFVAGAWLVVLGLASCRWTTARYTLDFAWLMIAGSILCTEAGLPFLEEAGVTVRPLRMAIAILCVLSMAAGMLLPFSRPPWTSPAVVSAAPPPGALR